MLVTTVGILHTVFNIYVLHMKPMDDTSMGEGYEKTKPWHPLYNIICFSIFGFLYMRGLEKPDSDGSTDYRRYLERDMHCV